ncbi:MAG: sigma-70 family RNA polymerase sigma factor [Clostridia bacterium]|nr:sigma-70 family RNA polymerase sigma factor [Clostridia bacterium]
MNARYAEPESVEADEKGCVIPLPPFTDPEDVYRRYSGMVFRLALARCRSRVEAEDVMQDVFLRYVRRAPKLESAEHQRAWLIKATINCTNTLLSSAWNKRTALYSELTQLAPMLPDENAADIYAAVLRLPKKQRTAVHLYYYEGYRVKEIASLMDVSESGVKSLLHRAREGLEKDLKGDYFDV